MKNRQALRQLRILGAIVHYNKGSQEEASQTNAVEFLTELL